MAVSAYAAGVGGRVTIFGNVVVFLALGAANRLLLVLTDGYAFVGNANALSEDTVCRLDVDNLEECKCLSLFRSPSREWFDPSYRCDRGRRKMILLFDRS